MSLGTSLASVSTGDSPLIEQARWGTIACRAQYRPQRGRAPAIGCTEAPSSRECHAASLSYDFSSPPSRVVQTTSRARIEVAGTGGFSQPGGKWPRASCGRSRL